MTSQLRLAREREIERERHTIESETAIYGAIKLVRTCIAGRLHQATTT